MKHKRNTKIALEKKRIAFAHRFKAEDKGVSNCIELERVKIVEVEVEVED